MKGNPYPAGGQAAVRISKRLPARARQNALRVACQHCGLLILPQNMERHLEIVHDIEVQA